MMSKQTTQMQAKEKVETNADKQKIPNGLTCPEKQWQTTDIEESWRLFWS